MHTPFALAILIVTALTALAAASAQPDPFKITLRKPDDSVTVQADKDRTAFVVKSRSGIGQAVVERRQDAWPKVVALRLHVSGLESFRVAGKMTIDAAVVAIQDGKVKVRSWKDGQEKAAVDEKSPLWMDIRAFGDNGKLAKTLPNKDGYFEVTLPKALFEGNPKSITFNWIDFYR